MSTPQNHTSDRVAVITGAAGTLCSEIARALAKQGIRVALIGRSVEGLTAIETQIRELGGTALSIAADVTRFDAIAEAHKTIVAELGPVSILINGAGGNQFEAVTTGGEFTDNELEADPDDGRGFFNLDMTTFQSVLEINTLGTVIPCQVFARDMAKNKAGSIINFSSMNGARPLSRVPAYAMAKAGINNFTQWLAAYLAPANVRVNAIAPGFFLNEKNRTRLLTKEGNYTERGTNIIRQTPMHRFGDAAELVGCVNWLIDENAAGFVTGIVIPIDGGFLASSGI